MRADHRLKWLLRLVLFVVAGLPVFVTAETRRALLVGINTYISPQTTRVSASEGGSSLANAGGREKFSNLFGCVNDVEAMKAVLGTARFQFEPSNIHVLLESDATRAAILAEIQKRLIDEAGPGDVCLFFYAGHGSLVRNLQSNKGSGMDSTIVPVDSSRGAPDIRDKELARLFNKAVDKGVILIGIFDCCHSGSIARGLPGERTSRDLPPDPRPVSDPGDPGPAPEERGALIISAAQDYQAAEEGSDDHFTPHGAFTIAFLKAVKSTLPNAPVSQLFQSCQMMLQAEKPGQVPVLAGLPERHQKPLLGIGTSVVSCRTMATVAAVDLVDITLAAGQAIGLEVGCELQRLPQPGENTNQAALRIRIKTVDGFSKSIAQVLGNPATIKLVHAGDIFEVTHWVYPSAATLRVWVPAGPTLGEIKALARELGVLRDSTKLQWLEDPTESTPTHVLSWNARGWTLSGVGTLGKKLRAQDVLQKLGTSGGEKPKLFVSLPIPKELATSLKLGDGSANSSIYPVAAEPDANYQLAGRWMDSGPEYAWIRPNAAREDMLTNALPIRSDWFALTDNGNSAITVARELEDKAIRIGRLKAWLLLDSHSSNVYFPYHLALRNTANGKTKGFGDTTFGGEPYGLVLQADPGAQLDRVEKQWIYIVTIDSWGKTSLVFPPVSQGHVGNRVPYITDGQSIGAAPREILLGNPLKPKLFTISKPFGVDTYALLTSSQEIPDPSIFNGEGARTRGATENNVLQDLFANLGARTRAATPDVPTDWSLQKILVRSEPPPQ